MRFVRVLECMGMHHRMRNEQGREMRERRGEGEESRRGKYKGKRKVLSTQQSEQAFHVLAVITNYQLPCVFSVTMSDPNRPYFPSIAAPVNQETKLRKRNENNSDLIFFSIS